EVLHVLACIIFGMLRRPTMRARREKREQGAAVIVYALLAATALVELAQEGRQAAFPGWSFRLTARNPGIEVLGLLSHNRQWYLFIMHSYVSPFDPVSWKQCSKSQQRFLIGMISKSL